MTEDPTPRCRLCDRPVPPEEMEDGICPECWWDEGVAT